MRISSIPGVGRLAALALGAVLAAACSDRTGTQPAYYPSATPSPAIGASATVTTSTTSTTVVPAVASGGITVNATLPVASAAVSVTETTSTSAPAGINALGTSNTFSTKRGAAAVTDSASDYLEFTSTGAVTLDGVPAMSFTLPALTPGATYYLASYNDAGGAFVLPGEGPGVISGTTVTFAAAAGSETITPTAPLVYVLYAATGTPDTPTPMPAPVASPSSLVFDATSPSPQAIAVSEPGATGNFTASITCSAAPDTFVAELQNTTTTAPSGSFSVLNGSDVGTCTVTISDASGAQTTVAIQNNAYELGISGVRRK